MTCLTRKCQPAHYHKEFSHTARLAAKKTFIHLNEHWRTETESSPGEH